MPFDPIKKTEEILAQEWFARMFSSPRKEFHPNSRDRSRLLVWDEDKGRLRTLAFGPGGDGLSAEQKVRLYESAKENHLFYYPPGSAYPLYITETSFLPCPSKALLLKQEVKEPEVVPEFNEEPPRPPAVEDDEDEFSFDFVQMPDYENALTAYNERAAENRRKRDEYPLQKKKYDLWKRQYDRAQQLPDAVEQHINEAASGQIDPQETAELNARDAASDDYVRLHRYESANDVLNAIFSHQPRPVFPVVSTVMAGNAALSFDEFNTIGEAAYDLPENCKLSEDEVSLLNFVAMSDEAILPLAYNMDGAQGERVAAQSLFANSDNMIETGVLFTPRHGIDVARMKAGLLLGQELVADFTAGNAERLGQVLGNAIRRHNLAFSSFTDLSTLDKGGSGIVTSRMLDMLEKHPELKKAAALTEAELNHAKAEVVMHEVTVEASRARIRLQRSGEGLETLSPDEKLSCLQSIALERHISRSLRMQYDIAIGSPETLRREREIEEKRRQIEEQQRAHLRSLGEGNKSQTEALRDLYLSQGGTDIGAFEEAAAANNPMFLYGFVFGTAAEAIMPESNRNKQIELPLYQQLAKEGGLDALKQEISSNLELPPFCNKYNERDLCAVVRSPSFDAITFSKGSELQQLNALSDVLNDANRGRFIGSSQFRATKNALKAWSDALENEPFGFMTKAQTQRRQTLLTELRDASKAYLESKDALAAGDESTNGKNLRENARIAAVRRVYHYAEDAVKSAAVLSASKEREYLKLPKQEADKVEAPKMSEAEQPPKRRSFMAENEVVGADMADALLKYLHAKRPRSAEDKFGMLEKMNKDVDTNLRAIFTTSSERAWKNRTSGVFISLNEAESDLLKHTIAKALVLQNCAKGENVAFNTAETQAEMQKNIDTQVNALCEPDSNFSKLLSPMDAKQMLTFLYNGPANTLLDLEDILSPQSQIESNIKSSVKEKQGKEPEGKGLGINLLN